MTFAGPNLEIGTKYALSKSNDISNLKRREKQWLKNGGTK
jgi:hypothetical protein